ncbi:MAG: hypothetical protein RIC35_09115 [Marinoscillum sp.]
MLSKAKVQETVKDLPDTFSLDEIVDRLILISSIEEGLEQTKKEKHLLLKKPGRF